MAEIEEFAKRLYDALDDRGCFNGMGDDIKDEIIKQINSMSEVLVVGLPKLEEVLASCDKNLSPSDKIKFLEFLHKTVDRFFEDKNGRLS